MVSGSSLIPLLCCPGCRAPLEGDWPALRCSTGCAAGRGGFPVASGQPVLIHFEDSIFERSAYADGRGAVLPRDDSGKGLRTRVRSLITGGNPLSAGKVTDLLSRLKSQPGGARLLIIGGGARGVGTEALYAEPSVSVVGTDVYASAHTAVVADAHRLPFVDESFDAVWIQAVLEHVLEPERVAAEIYRVLCPGGLVYADTPFLQQVHEGAYDFSRFTQSGQRWLFRRFEQIDAGAVSGPVITLLWSYRYFIRSLGSGDKLATAATLPLSWLRLLEPLSRGRRAADGASGTYFYGRKSNQILRPMDMVAYYASTG